MDIFQELYEYDGTSENVACQHSSGINYDCYLELTLNPTPSKRFESTEKGYIELYCKILNYLKSSLNKYLILKGDQYYFEQCKSKKLHLHAKIDLIQIGNISPIGVIYDLVEYIMKLLRRKIPKDSVYPQNNSIKTQPVCCNFRYVHNTERLEHWENYIKKNAL